MIRTSILALVLVAGQAGAGTIYYDNTNSNNDTETDIVYSAGPYDGIGDSITLSAAATGATDAFAQFYNDGDSGTFDATLQFFQAGSPVGTQIGDSYDVTDIAVGADSEVDVDFELNDLDLPQDVAFLLEVANASPGVDPGVELYSNPPDVGSNTTDTAVVLQDLTYSQLTTGEGGGNPYFELENDSGAENLTPEPTSWLLTAIGLGALIACRRLGKITA